MTQAMIDDLRTHRTVHLLLLADAREAAPCPERREAVTSAREPEPHVSRGIFR